MSPNKLFSLSFTWGLGEQKDDTELQGQGSLGLELEKMRLMVLGRQGDAPGWAG